VYYNVQPGDTLYSIASRFGTTVQAIMQANNLTSPFVYVGQRLFIPVAPPQYPPFPPFPPGPGPGPGPVPGNLVERVDRLEDRVNQLARRVRRIEEQLQIRSDGEE
jgi:LysM repeat protein